MKFISQDYIDNNINLKNGISPEMLEVLRIGGCQYIADSRFNILEAYTQNM